MAKEKKQDKTKYLILLLLLITFMAVCITIWALFFRDPPPPLTPDYAPQETEERMETIPGDTGEKAESADGGGSVSLTYSKEVVISLTRETASLLFANPGKSNQDMVLQIVIQDEIIVQSGTLTPGHQVTELDLLPGAEKKLTNGIYEGKFVVLFYNEETGEKAVVNTEIPITITVKD